MRMWSTCDQGVELHVSTCGTERHRADLENTKER